MTKNVCFASSPRTIVYEDNLTKQERNTICWYSNAELRESRLDAKRAVQLLLLNRGNVEKARAEEGNDQISFRGVEKYGNSQIRELKKNKLLVHSILLRQTEHARMVEQGRETVCLKEELAIVSKRLSAPCTTLAHFHASKCFHASSEDDNNDSCQKESEKRDRLYWEANEGTKCAKRRKISLSPVPALGRQHCMVFQREVTAREA
jgi:hypothetical protein